jgi:hypothetical protein
VVEVIEQASSATTLSASSLSPAFGQPVTLTAHVGCAAAPTGTVTFFEGATAIGTAPVNGSGNATLTVNGLAAGSHTFTAHYSGDSYCSASASPVITVIVGCQTISGLRFGSLAVTGPVCLAPGTRIFGSVTISGAGSLDAEGASIGGALIATGGTGLQVCSTTVGGPVSVSGVNGVIVIGDAGDDGTPVCGANTVSGPVILTGNQGFVELSGNTVLGSVTVDFNTTTSAVPPENAAATEIEANRIGGSLACTGNIPPPVNDGGRPNSVVGVRSGQCAGL